MPLCIINSSTRTFVVIMLIIIVTFIVSFFAFVTVAPPQSVTLTNVGVLANKIQETGSVAAATDQLVKAGRTDVLEDAWGRKILIDQAGTSFTLTSLGRDGIEGGAGEDSDIRFGFDLNNKVYMRQIGISEPYKFTLDGAPDDLSEDVFMDVNRNAGITLPSDIKVIRYKTNSTGPQYIEERWLAFSKSIFEFPDNDYSIDVEFSSDPHSCIEPVSEIEQLAQLKLPSPVLLCKSASWQDDGCTVTGGLVSTHEGHFYLLRRLCNVIQDNSN